MIRILVADDEALIRDAVSSLLRLEDDFDVCAVAAGGEEAVAAAARTRPDVAVLDLQMPGIDGVAAAVAIAEAVPHCRTVIVTGHGRAGHLKRALAAGVAGFVPKTVSAATLALVIRAVAGGERYVDPNLAAEAIAAGDSPLSPRESDVLELAADGAPVEEIAGRAHLSQGTVRNYLSAAASKLGAANRHEAVTIARHHGWI